MMIECANMITYTFLTETYKDINADNAFCVPYKFIDIYGELFKKLTMEYLTDLCDDVRSDVKPKETKQITCLD